MTRNLITAREVLKHSEEMGRLLGTVYGRLQDELLIPLLHGVLAFHEVRCPFPWDSTLATIWLRARHRCFYPKYGGTKWR